VVSDRRSSFFSSLRVQQALLQPGDAMAQQPGGLHREVFAGLLVEVVQIDARAAPKRFQKASSRRSRGAGTAAGLAPPPDQGRHDQAFLVDLRRSARWRAGARAWPGRPARPSVAGAFLRGPGR
jgi:hypothetical protein